MRKAPKRIAPMAPAPEEDATAPAALAPVPDPPTPRREITPAHRPRARRRSTTRRIAAATLGVTLVAGGAYAATNWVVGLNAGSSGLGQAATVQNLSISAVSSPAAGSLLYPGAAGDVVLTISNPNPYPVTLTGVSLPTNTTYATGYTSSALTTTQSGCLAATPSGVTWSFATSSSGSAHTFTTPLTVAASGSANNPLTVTLTGDAAMSASAPAACAGAYFAMPSLTGVAASGGSATATTSPATDAWTS